MKKTFFRGGQDRPTGFYLPIIEYVQNLSLKKMRRSFIDRPTNFFIVLKKNNLRPSETWLPSRKYVVNPPKKPTVPQPTLTKGVGAGLKVGVSGAFKAAMAFFSSGGGGGRGIPEYKPPHRTPDESKERRIFSYGHNSYG